MNIAIVDLDGTISDDRHRAHLKGDWDAYNALCESDPVMNRYIIDDNLAAGRTIVILTARPQNYNAITRAWLNKHWPGDAEHFWVVMRPEGDRRSSPELKVERFEHHALRWEDVREVWDDRKDVCRVIAAKLEEYGNENFMFGHVSYPPEASPSGVPAILRAMAATFEERNAVYGSNYLTVAPTIKALFPAGVPSELVTTNRWHLFELLVVKLSRFAVSELTHVDSIHDAAVYAAMIEGDLQR